MKMRKNREELTRRLSLQRMARPTAAILHTVMIKGMITDKPVI
jgi:hypothetical protein